MESCIDFSWSGGSVVDQFTALKLKLQCSGLAVWYFNLGIAANFENY